MPFAIDYRTIIYGSIGFCVRSFATRLLRLPPAPRRSGSLPSAACGGLRRLGSFRSSASCKFLSVSTVTLDGSKSSICFSRCASARRRQAERARGSARGPLSQRGACRQLLARRKLHVIVRGKSFFLTKLSSTRFEAALRGSQRAFSRRAPAAPARPPSQRA